MAKRKCGDLGCPTSTEWRDWLYGTGGSVTPPQAPSNTALPVISGTAQVGEPLTADNGSWTEFPTSYTFQWKRNGTNISGATSSNYTPVSADYNTVITVTVTATNNVGSTPATSLGTAAVLPAVPVNNVSPVLSGTYIVGNSLSLTNGTWTAQGTINYSYAWLRSGVVVSGQTANTYLLTSADEGHIIQGRVTATNAGGAVNAFSNESPVITELPVNTVAPVISGTPEQGQILSTTNGTWSGTTPISYTYQWKRDGVNIGGATNSTYTVQGADIAKAITVSVTGTNTAGNASATSNSLSILGELGHLEWQYNNTDYAYITSSSAWSDVNGQTIVSNLIGAYTVGTNDSQGANTGVSYDFANDDVPANDRVAVKTYNNNRYRAFPKSVLPPGTSTTIPTPAVNFLMQGSQGIVVDNISGRIFECLENTQEIRITDLAGVEIEKFSVPAAALEPSTVAYDPVTETLYVTLTDKRMHAYRKISGTWTDTGTLPFITDEGNCIDLSTGRIWTHRIFNGGVGTIRVCEQDVNGWYNGVYQIPLLAGDTTHEGIVVDPRDGTLWMCRDKFFHGGINNGNILAHFDPQKVYRKRQRYPDATRYSKFKIDGGTYSGQYNYQRIKASGWSISPICDFAANTYQQNAGALTSRDSAFDAEYRGSGTAPTTTSYNSGHLDEWDANGTNDGWGSTVPGAWQSTPTTDRYMQFRVKPKQYTAPVEFDFASLGLDLLIIANTKDGIYWDPFDSNRVEVLVNKLNPNYSFRQSAQASKPTFNSANGYVTKVANAFMTLDNPASILAEAGGEIGWVSRSASGTTTNQVIAFSASVPTAATINIFRAGHYRSNESAFANAQHLTHITGAGVTSRIGFVDTDHAATPLISFTSSAGTNKGYRNAVEQTLTNNAGTNTGKWFNTVAATVLDTGATRTNNTFIGGLYDLKVLYHKPGSPLTDAQRLSLYNALVARGGIIS